ncbi:MAG TPA: BrnA antitoxin family protein [Candidatus Binatia bacterium]|jgi:predicted DNA binding CopG/RHH family protein
MTDEELARARRVSGPGRPQSGNVKHMIAIRIAPDVLFKLRQMAAKRGKPYQTFIHDMLERATKREK